MPSWCLTEKELIVGLVPDKVKGYLSRKAISNLGPMCRRLPKALATDRAQSFGLYRLETDFDGLMPRFRCSCNGVRPRCNSRDQLQRLHASRVEQHPRPSAAVCGDGAETPRASRLPSDPPCRCRRHVAGESLAIALLYRRCNPRGKPPAGRSRKIT